MSRTRAFKRLSTAVLTGAVIAATPFAFATPAHAAVATQQIITPYLSGLPGSYKFDGTNSTIPLYTEILQATPPNNLAAFVQWSYNQIDPTCAAGTFVNIGGQVPVQKTLDPTATGDANTKFFATTEWAPPANAAFCIRSQVFEANGVTVIDTKTRASYTVSNASDTTEITLPAKGGFAGYYAGKVNMQGTSSSQIAGPAGFSNSGTAPLVYDGSTTKWSATPALPGAFAVPTASANTYIGSTNGLTDAPTGQFVVWDPTVGSYTERTGVVYLQSLSTFAASPPSANKQPYAGALPISSTAVPATNLQRYTWLAVDQKGNPIPGLPLDVKFNDPSANASFCAYDVPATGVAPVASFSGGAAAQCGAGSTATTNATPPVPKVTDAFGRFRADVVNLDSEVLNVTVRTLFAGGVFNPAIDFSTGATFTTATAVATAGTAVVSGSPTFSIYPTQTYGSPTGPALTVNVKDAVGSPILGQTVLSQVTRTILSGLPPGGDGTGFTYPKTFALTSSAPTDSNGNTVITPPAVPLPPTATPNSPTPTANALSTNGESGFDMVQTYIEKNGIPGYQAGDLLIDNTRINFGPERIFVKPCDTVSPVAGLPSSACLAQQKAGVDKPVNVIDTIFGAVTGTTPGYVPVTGRKLDITISNQLLPAPVPFVGTAGSPTGFGFSPTNPGVTVLTPTSANVTTDSTGSAGVNIYSANPQSFVVTASDPSLGGTFISDDGSVLLSFNSFSAVLNGIGAATVTRIAPAGNIGGVPGAPGEPLFFTAPLTDQNGAPLANETVALKVSQGFFTAFPTVGLTYPSLTFNTAIAGNAPIAGDIKNLGTTVTATTNSAGVVAGIIGTVRDAGYDASGDIAGTVTATFGTATKNVPVPTSGPAGTLYSTNFLRDGGSSVAPAATNPIQIIEGTLKNTGQFVPSSPAAKPSGDKAVANVNSIPSDFITTIAHQTDSFGNLVREGIAVATSGTVTGVLTVPGTHGGAFLNDFLAAAPTPGRIVTLTNPAAQNPPVGPETVTYTWTAPANTWLVNTTTGAVGINALTTPATDAYTINWYARTAPGLHVDVKLLPSGASAPAGTPVNVAATVTDVKGRPVKGVGIQFFRSGPKGEAQNTPNPFTCAGSNCSDAIFTDANGSGGWTFLSTKVGGVTITTIVTDLSGNEVFRDVKHFTYTGFPRPVLMQSSHNGEVTLTTTVDPSFAGKTIQYFVRSGLTNHVRNLGTADVDPSGTAVRVLHLTPGQHILVYCKIEGVTEGIEDIRSGDKALLVS